MYTCKLTKCLTSIVTFQYHFVYGCSFDAKLSRKFFFFKEKKGLFFPRYTLFAEKNVYMEKSFILKNIFTENLFYREKYIWKCKKYVSCLRNIYLYRKCLCYKWNISFFKYIFILQKKFYLIIKNVFLKTSWWTQ